MRFKFFLVFFSFLITCKLSAQNSFLELDEQLYNSALSVNNNLLAVASKKKVFFVDTKSLAILKTVVVIKDNKSENVIGAINFDRNDSLLTIKIFNRDQNKESYEDEDYFFNFTYSYNIEKDVISESYPALEYLSNSNNKKIKGFNEVHKNIASSNSKKRYLTLRSNYSLTINDTLLDNNRYEEWKGMLEYLRTSVKSELTANDSILKETKGRIRHLKLSHNGEKVAVVYLDSINSETNYYTIELRDSNSLDILASNNYSTTNIIDNFKFIENDTYVVVYEKKILPNYYNKKSKSSVYWENFVTDISIRFLDTDSLKTPSELIDADINDFAVENNSYWVIEDNNIVNYDYNSKEVLRFINNFDFDFHRIRGFYKINSNEALIIGSAQDKYNKDYVTKNGIQKYSLEDTKLYNEISNFKDVDTLYSANTPFIQNNSFDGDKITFNANNSMFISQINYGKTFQLWSAKARKKLHEIDLDISSSSYLSQNGESVLIFSRPDNLDNGFLLRKLDVKTGILTSKQFIVSYGENPMLANFYYNHKGSKWIGVYDNIIWEIDLDLMSYKPLLELDFNVGYVFDFKFLVAQDNKIYFKGIAYSEITKREIRAVWIFDTNTNELLKIDELAESKDVFKFNADKLIFYNEKKYAFYDINTQAVTDEYNINSQFIYNVLVNGDKSYVLFGDGERHSHELSVLEYNNISNSILAEFKLKINYSFSSDFTNFFASEDGLVYYNEGDLNLYTPELEFTSKWGYSIDNKGVRYVHVGNSGKLIIDGVHSLDLKTLELIKIKEGLDDRYRGDFFLSNGDEKKQLMITVSDGFKDNNKKPYIQFKLVNDNISKEVVWESKKIEYDDYSSFKHFRYLVNDKFIVLYNTNSTVENYYIIDLQNQSLAEIKFPFKEQYLSPENIKLGKTKLYLYDYESVKTYVYDLVSGKLLNSIKDIKVTDELEDEKLLYVNKKKYNDAFYLGSLKEGEIIEEFEYNAHINGDNYIFYKKRDFIIGIYRGLYFWNKNEKTPFKIIKLESIESMLIQDDKLFLLLRGGTIKVIDLNNLEEILTIDILEKNEVIKPVFFTPEGYFNAAKENIRNYHFVKGVEAFSLLNYELFLNRPDVILDRLGYANKNVVNIYKDAFLKRLKRNNLSENTNFLSISRPQISLINIAEIPSITDDNSLQLEMRNVSKSDTLSIYINGVPVSISSVRDKLVISKSVKLNNGINNISIVSKLKSGVESDPITLEIRNISPKKESKVHYVGIGVSKYLDNSMNLKYADKDVRRLTEVFTEKFKGRIIIDTLLNENVTLENVKELKTKLNETSIEDTVIISFSGHGLIGDEDRFYFAAHDIDFNSPETNGISYEVIQDLLSNIPARKKLLLLDACHSGEIDTTEDLKTTVFVNEHVVENIPEGAKGSKIIEGKKGLNDSFELMQSLFYDMDRGNGSYVISAAGGYEYAYEDEKWENGVFTYSFINALKDLGVNVGEEESGIPISKIKKYVYDSVNALTNGRQKPTSRAENLEWDWGLE